MAYDRGLLPFLFKNEHLVRILVDFENEPWFAGVDVCRVLGLRNSRDALSRLSPDERKTITNADGFSGNADGFRGPPPVFLNEAGVFRLIFSSRKPEAEAFKRWLAHDVLPSIRRTGRYESAAGALAKANALALNSASRAVSEIRRSLGSRAAAATLPELFAKAGITIRQREQEQPYLNLENETDDKVVEIVPGVRVTDTELQSEEKLEEPDPTGEDSSA